MPGAKQIPAGLLTRIISALVLIPLVLTDVYYGSHWFSGLVIVGGCILAWEWRKMCQNKLLWLLFGAFYITIPCWALIHIRADDVAGLETMIWLFAVVWAMDIGGYAFGVSIGGPKLAPRISPNKTWAGMIGGTLMSTIAGGVCASLLGYENIVLISAISAGIGVVSQFGDLVESSLKRHFDVKDSGSIIPGHGGLFDRVDGLMVAAVAVALLGAQGRGSVLLWL